MNWTMRWVGVCLLFSLGWGVAGTRAQQRPVAAEPQAPSRTARAPSEVVPTLAVPRLIKFAGTLKDAQGKPLSNTVGLTFAIYKDQEGGAPLWLETQNAQLDEQGHYSVLLGATKSEGLPLELFSSGEPRWLGVIVQLPREVEGPRVLLVSVPYALKAADADALGGIPASAFVLAAPTGTTSGTGVLGSITQTRGNSKTPERTPASGSAETAAAAAPITAGAGRVYVPITPCRIVDTRIPSPNPLVANITRTFNVVGSTNDFAGQGGDPGGCGIPGFLGPSMPQVQAVMFNFVAVNPAGGGDLRAWASDHTVPLASILNYAAVPLLNLANGIIVPVRQDLEGNDLSVRADVSGADLVVDVLGYFSDFAPGQVVRSLSGQTDNVTLNGTNGLSVSASSGTVTVTSNATSTNTLGSIVSRDGSGNFSAGAVTLAGNLKITGVGNALVFPDGTVQTTAGAGGGGTGTVTSVAAGAGLSASPANPITSSGTFSIATGGVTNSMLVNSSITVNTGTGLSGGGAVALGNLLTLSNTGVLSFNGRAGSVTPTAGDYSFSQISGAATAAQLPVASLVRAITYLAGCDSCSLLTTADSQNTIFVNLIGGMTISSVTCFSDAGAPTVNIQNNHTGTLTNILSANLSCSATGATSSSFSTSMLSLNDSLNFIMATADGVAKRVTVIIKATVN